MIKDEQHIDILFTDNFSNYKIKPSGDHWESIYQKANKKLFFKPNFKKFNFIYSFLITSSFIFTLSIFIDYFYINDPVIQPTNSHHNINLFDSSIVKTVYIRDTIIHKVAIKNTEQNIYIDTTDIINNYLNNRDINQMSEINKLEYSNEIEDSVKNEIQSKKEKNINIIYRTIEKTDTVILYKEKPDVIGKRRSVFDVNNR